MTKAQIADQEQARAQLRESLKPGDTVTTTITHVARSGMSRRVKALIVRDAQVADVSWLVARAIGAPLKDGAIVVGGCGFDAGFEVVSNLSYYLHGRDWTCTGQDCPSNDHSNGDRNYEPHTHHEGGYTLHHRSL